MTWFHPYRQHSAYHLIALLALVIVAVSCNDSGNSDAADIDISPPDAYPGGDLLVSPEWVAARIDDDDLRIIDLSSIRTYHAGHLPGARHIWWQDTIEIHNEVYGMLTHADIRERLIARAGIQEGTFVVVYDDAGGHDAARFLWMLHAIGFEDVALLNGGRQAWEQAGFNLSARQSDHPDGTLDQSLNYDVLIGADDVQTLLDDPDVIIIDGRTEEERAETWFDRLRTGQIPGSIHVPRDTTIHDDALPVFRSPEELGSLLPDEVEPGQGHMIIVYGLHGPAAAHTWLTMKLIGFQDVRLYDGSWAEWGADPSRPIEPIPGSDGD